jgi:transcriptional regulator with XRE-family HTH domain
MESTKGPMTGDAMRQARCRAKLTQHELGVLLGFTEPYASRIVQKWEYGQRPIPLNLIRRLSAILEVPIDRFIP